MKKQKMLSPDPPPAGGTPPPVSHKPGIPAGDVDFMAVADAVQTKWKTTAAITLVWTDADAFKDLVLAYIATLTGRLPPAAAGRYLPTRLKTSIMIFTMQ